MPQPSYTAEPLFRQNIKLISKIQGFQLLFENISATIIENTNLTTDYRFFGIAQPVSPSENQVFQQFLALAVINGHRFQMTNTLKYLME